MGFSTQRLDDAGTTIKEIRKSHKEMRGYMSKGQLMGNFAS